MTDPSLSDGAIIDGLSRYMVEARTQVAPWFRRPWLWVRKTTAAAAHFLTP